jgi:hypothetical protein
MNGHRHTQAGLIPLNEHPYPPDRRLSRCQIRSGHDSEEEMSQKFPVVLLITGRAMLALSKLHCWNADSLKSVQQTVNWVQVAQDSFQ